MSKTFDVLYYRSDNNGRGPGYIFSHKYTETWKSIAMFCPHCGKQEVWQEDSAGDYYVGEGYICTACSHEWTMQGPNEIKRGLSSSNSQDEQRLNWLWSLTWPRTIPPA